MTTPQSALVLALILVALILALIEGARSKWQSLLIIAVVVLAFAVAIQFVW
jgi:hypothetical protein